MSRSSKERRADKDLARAVALDVLGEHGIEQLPDVVDGNGHSICDLSTELVAVVLSEEGRISPGVGPPAGAA